jgi:hypothetical protein
VIVADSQVTEPILLQWSQHIAERISIMQAPGAVGHLQMEAEISWQIVTCLMD